MPWLCAIAQALINAQASVLATPSLALQSVLFMPD
jgi:hypothetical protein